MILEPFSPSAYLFDIGHSTVILQKAPVCLRLFILIICGIEVIFWGSQIDSVDHGLICELFLNYEGLPLLRDLLSVLGLLALLFCRHCLHEVQLFLNLLDPFSLTLNVLFYVLLLLGGIPLQNELLRRITPLTLYPLTLLIFLLCSSSTEGPSRHRP